jgi:hypothetical protein
MNAPIADQILATVRNHEDLAEAFRKIKDMLGLSDAFCDEIGGLTVGHTNKCLGPTGYKNIGATPFGIFCEMFGVEFRMVINLDAVRRMEARWERRNAERIRIENRRPSKELIERSKPHVLKAAARHANAARNAMLTSEHRTSIARKAAKARWRKKRTPKAKLVAEAVSAAAVEMLNYVPIDPWRQR